MTLPDRDYDDILSRALRSTLDPIEPAGDGLTKIQRRIAEPWLRRQLSLIRMELSALGWLVAVRSEPFRTGVRSRLAVLGRSGHRPRSAPGALGAAAAYGRRSYSAGRSARAGDFGLRRWLGPTMNWLRPALAVAGAVVIVVVGVFALGRFQASFIGASNQTGSPSQHGGRGGTGPGTKDGHGAHVPGGPSRTQGPSRGRKPNSKSPSKTGHKRNPASSSSPVPSPSPSSVSPSPSASASPSSSPTSSPTSTPTPTPTGPIFGLNGRTPTPKPQP
jgi:hypothetical protein